MANAARIVIKNVPDWVKAKGRLDAELAASMRRIATHVASRAAEAAPTDTGRLRKSIGSEYRREGERHIAMIGTGLEYAPYVHEGTGPAVGRPPYFPPPSALADWARRVLGNEKLAWAVARKIRARGTKPRPYLRNALAGSRGFIEAELHEALRRSVQ